MMGPRGRVQVWSNTACKYVFHHSFPPRDKDHILIERQRSLLQCFNEIIVSSPILCHASVASPPNIMARALTGTGSGSSSRFGPRLYAESRTGARFTWASLTGWLVRAAYQGAVIYGVMTDGFGYFGGSSASGGSSATDAGAHGTGADAGLAAQSAACFTALIVLLTVTMALESSSITWLNALALGGTFAVYLGVSAAVAAWAPPTAVEFGVFTAVAFGVGTGSTGGSGSGSASGISDAVGGGALVFWTRQLLCAVACLVPPYAFAWFGHLYAPTPAQALRARILVQQKQQKQTRQSDNQPMHLQQSTRAVPHSQHRV
jgi:hypothetical protein